MIAKPYFKPWVGENYGTSRPRILILGESHYGDGQELESFTKEVIKDWAIAERGSRRFFTVVAKILSEKPYIWMSPSDKRNFWQSVAFYNYVQVIVGKESRIRPTERMWLDSQNALKHVLTELSPDIVIVLGKELRIRVESILDKFHTISTCYWSHPSAPKYFNKHAAIQAFDEAKRRFAK